MCHHLATAGTNLSGEPQGFRLKSGVHKNEHALFADSQGQRSLPPQDVFFGRARVRRALLEPWAPRKASPAQQTRTPAREEPAFESARAPTKGALGRRERLTRR